MADDRKTTPENATLLQAFEWNVPADQKHWLRLQAALPSLKEIGVTSVWIPPACKASSPKGNGYDIYDLYDLGEFDQKGGVATKWGTKKELQDLCWRAGELGVGIYFDAVLNHKAGADTKEKCRAVEVDENDRNKEISEPYEIDAWLGFNFRGRGDKYSAQKYHWYHFSGTDYNAANEKTAIYKLKGEGKSWSTSVSDDQGNADFMMFADLDYSHEEVTKDVINWGIWATKELGLKGFRLDAVNHFSERFTNEWITALRHECGNIFIVGEAWEGSRDKLVAWLEEMDHKFTLYDAPLLYNFARVSGEERADLRKIFDNSLVQVKPMNAVTVVANHDTQPGQTLDTPIAPFFKPLAYALILLRPSGYPCLFYGDLYGLLPKEDSPKDKVQDPSCSGMLPTLVKARQLYAYGECNDYFSDDANCVGWVRRGTWDRLEGACAVVMSNAAPGEKNMFVGEEHKGEIWTDVLGWARDGDQEKQVVIGEDGFGLFTCGETSVSVFVKRTASGRDSFPLKVLLAGALRRGCTDGVVNNRHIASKDEVAHWNPRSVAKGGYQGRGCEAACHHCMIGQRVQKGGKET
ncbi:hypothetical protein FH972_022035 [Carpinus fangiana]|uniref:1,4-alpha-D-glucan glucanohydrolase n=1 Tax=Carpinus fangiana TaxID=176857 RepID=A0A5N6KRM3_9ROSI|nr:hypothetical protein FH972_022035 [Carpinus fangiana]